MITISWHFLTLIIIIIGLWIFAFTRDNSGMYFTDRDLWIVISLILSITLILIYGGIFWWWEEISMLVTVKFRLDHTWDGYENIDKELFLDDIIDKMPLLKEGIEPIEIVNIEQEN